MDVQFMSNFHTYLYEGLLNKRWEKRIVESDRWGYLKWPEDPDKYAGHIITAIYVGREIPKVVIWNGITSIYWYDHISEPPDLEDILETSRSITFSKQDTINLTEYKRIVPWTPFIYTNKKILNVESFDRYIHVYVEYYAIDIHPSKNQCYPSRKVSEDRVSCDPIDIELHNRLIQIDLFRNAKTVKMRCKYWELLERTSPWNLMETPTVRDSSGYLEDSEDSEND